MCALLFAAWGEGGARGAASRAFAALSVTRVPEVNMRACEKDTWHLLIDTCTTIVRTVWYTSYQIPHDTCHLTVEPGMASLAFVAADG